MNFHPLYLNNEFVHLIKHARVERNVQFQNQCHRGKFNKLFIVLSYLLPFPSFCFSPTEAKAIILGQSDLYVKMGSKVILTCVISQGPHDLGTISWYRGEYLLALVYILINLDFINFLKFLLNSFSKKGSMRINQTQLNDLALSYPLRVSVDVKWTEALTSR